MIQWEKSDGVPAFTHRSRPATRRPTRRCGASTCAATAACGPAGRWRASPSRSATPTRRSSAVTHNQSGPTSPPEQSVAMFTTPPLAEDVDVARARAASTCGCPRRRSTPTSRSSSARCAPTARRSTSSAAGCGRAIRKEDPARSTEIRPYQTHREADAELLTPGETVAGARRAVPDRPGLPPGLRAAGLRRRRRACSPGCGASSAAGAGAQHASPPASPSRARSRCRSFPASCRRPESRPARPSTTSPAARTRTRCPRRRATLSPMRRALAALPRRWPAGCRSAPAAQPPTTTKRVVAGDTEAAYGKLLYGPGLEARRCATTWQRPARAGPKRRTSLAVLRPAHRLPARRRGVPGAGRVARPGRHAVHLRVAPAGGARAVHRSTPPSARSTASPTAARSPRASARARQARAGRSSPATTPTTSSATRSRGSRQLLEGGPVDPNSGVERDARRARRPVAPGEARALHRRAGLRRRRPTRGRFYDPDEPTGTYAAFPAWPGLMDRAQLPFTARGLKVPSYVSFGNHDGQVQGNQAATATFDDGGDRLRQAADLGRHRARADRRPRSATSVAVPPDPERAFVSRAEYMAVTGAGRQADDHGFAFVGQAEREASAGRATYYSFRRRRRCASSPSTRWGRARRSTPRATSTTRSSAGSSATLAAADKRARARRASSATTRSARCPTTTPDEYAPAVR